MSLQRSSLPGGSKRIADAAMKCVLAAGTSLLLLGASSPVAHCAEAADLINEALAFRTVIKDQTAPAGIASLIKLGDVTTTFVDDLAARGVTHFLIDFDWTFDYRYKILERHGGRQLKLTAENIKPKITLRHVVRMPRSYYRSSVWESQLMRHEFDHVAASADPRPLLLLRHLLRSISVIDHALQATGKPSSELCSKLINAELNRREQAVSALIRANYELLDKVSKHGTLRVPNRNAFFARLYTKPNLEEMRFPFVKEVVHLLETDVYRLAKLPHLAADPTEPAR